MYNGIGLQTPRGSGTNGYIQANKFFVKSRQQPTSSSSGGPAAQDAGISKKPNKEILEHDRKRRIQLQLVVLEDALADQGYTAAEIALRLDDARKTLEADTALEANRASAALPPPRFSDTQTHQIAARKEKQLETLRAALGIKREDGSSEQEAQEEMQQEIADKAEADKSDSEKLEERERDSKEIDKQKEKRDKIPADEDRKTRTRGKQITEDLRTEKGFRHSKAEMNSDESSDSDSGGEHVVKEKKHRKSDLRVDKSFSDSKAERKEHDESSDSDSGGKHVVKEKRHRNSDLRTEKGFRDSKAERKKNDESSDSDSSGKHVVKEKRHRKSDLRTDKSFRDSKAERKKNDLSYDSDSSGKHVGKEKRHGKTDRRTEKGFRDSQAERKKNDESSDSDSSGRHVAKEKRHVKTTWGHDFGTRIRKEEADKYGKKQKRHDKRGRCSDDSDYSDSDDSEHDFGTRIRKKEADKYGQKHKRQDKRGRHSDDSESSDSGGSRKHDYDDSELSDSDSSEGHLRREKKHKKSTQHDSSASDSSMENNKKEADKYGKKHSRHDQDSEIKRAGSDIKHLTHQRKTTNRRHDSTDSESDLNVEKKNSRKYKGGNEKPTRKHNISDSDSERWGKNAINKNKRHDSGDSESDTDNEERTGGKQMEEYINFGRKQKSVISEIDGGEKSSIYENRSGRSNKELDAARERPSDSRTDRRDDIGKVRSSIRKGGDDNGKWNHPDAIQKTEGSDRFKVGRVDKDTDEYGSQEARRKRKVVEDDYAHLNSKSVKGESERRKEENLDRNKEVETRGYRSYRSQENRRENPHSREHEDKQMREGMYRDGRDGHGSRSHNRDDRDYNDTKRRRFDDSRRHRDKYEDRYHKDASRYREH